MHDCIADVRDSTDLGGKVFRVGVTVQAGEPRTVLVNHFEHCAEGCCVPGSLKVIATPPLPGQLPPDILRNALPPPTGILPPLSFPEFMAQHASDETP